MENCIGLFTSPEFEGKTLVVRNGDVIVADMEKVLSGVDRSDSKEVWNMIINLHAEPCPYAVYRSDTWTPVSHSRSMYTNEFGVPTDWDIITDHRKAKEACKSVKEIVKETGMSQRAFARRFGIPLRTVEDWCRGINKCPLYVRLMMQECLNK